jgi:hypothetical protein
VFCEEAYKNFEIYLYLREIRGMGGHAVASLVEALRYKPKDKFVLGLVGG